MSKGFRVVRLNVSEVCRRLHLVYLWVSFWEVSIWCGLKWMVARLLGSNLVHAYCVLCSTVYDCPARVLQQHSSLESACTLVHTFYCAYNICIPSTA